jgi:hypothetical protein
VINQTAGSGNTGDILYFMRVLLFFAFLSMGYTLSRPSPASRKEPDLLLPDTAEPDPQKQEWPRLQPWQRKASEKAVERYAGSQEKKWQRWNEAMFERSA